METVSETLCFGGTQGVYRHMSDATGTSMALSVFTPPQAADRPVPVLIYLSGLTCSQENVTTKAGFQRCAAHHGVMMVCPDTSPRGPDVPDDPDGAYDFGLGAGFYVDATQPPFDRHYRMESYVTRDLPTLLQAEFPADLGRIGLMGHSMGGHGALTLGLRHPDLFTSISAIAPICAPSQCPWGQKAFTGYLGDDRSAWARHDAVELITASRGYVPPLLLDQGEADPFLSEQLKPELLARACADKGVDLTLRRHGGYDHSYFFIATVIADHLAHHADALKTA